MKNLNPSGHFPSGNTHFYYRPKGQKGVPMPDLPPDHPRFLAAYAEAAGGDTVIRSKPVSGSLSLAVEGYLKSDIFLLKYKSSTRSVRRRALDNIRARYGSARVLDLRTKHVVADLDQYTGHARNNRLKIWRAFGKWLADVYKISDPAAEAKKVPAPKTDGHIPWSGEEIDRFRDYWKIGSPERLAFELIYWTGARISDAVQLGSGHIDKDGWLVFVQEKTGGEVAIPFDRSLPEFAWDMADDLQYLKTALSARKERHITWITTIFGTSRSVKAASQWFAAKARVAGIYQRTAHGLRKSRARALAEAGGTSAQIGAWTGHESLSEIERYIRNFSKRKVLSSTKKEQKVPISQIEVPNQPKIQGKSNG